jgi:hypothetical protein
MFVLTRLWSWLRVFVSVGTWLGFSLSGGIGLSGLNGVVKQIPEAVFPESDVVWIVQFLGNIYFIKALD